MGERLFLMKTLAASAPQGVFNLQTQSISEWPLDAVELTDEDLEQVTGAWFFPSFFGGFFPSFFGGFFPSFGFSSFAGAFAGF